MEPGFSLGKTTSTSKRTGQGSNMDNIITRPVVNLDELNARMRRLKNLADGNEGVTQFTTIDESNPVLESMNTSGIPTCRNVIAEDVGCRISRAESVSESMMIPSTTPISSTVGVAGKSGFGLNDSGSLHDFTDCMEPITAPAVQYVQIFVEPESDVLIAASSYEPDNTFKVHGSCSTDVENVSGATDFQAEPCLVKPEHVMPIVTPSYDQAVTKKVQELCSTDVDNF